MKNFWVSILLFSYSLVLFKPVFPYVSDFISHLVLYKTHITSVHHEQGKSHVHKELVKIAIDFEDQKIPLSPKEDNKGNEHITYVCESPVLIQVFYLSRYRMIGNPSLLLGTHKPTFQPPRS
ncbi:MAG: hypothetical protein H7X88_08615 [Gloeobacteraceae cyanobacterium ES-bin-316]|nr:hypothetical protein [Ferruginibacter sp.]